MITNAFLSKEFLKPLHCQIIKARCMELWQIVKNFQDRQNFSWLFKSDDCSTKYYVLLHYTLTVRYMLILMLRLGWLCRMVELAQGGSVTNKATSSSFPSFWYLMQRSSHPSLFKTSLKQHDSLFRFSSVIVTKPRQPMPISCFFSWQIQLYKVQI